LNERIIGTTRSFLKGALGAGSTKLESDVNKSSEKGIPESGIGRSCTAKADHIGSNMKPVPMRVRVSVMA